PGLDAVEKALLKLNPPKPAQVAVSAKEEQPKPNLLQWLSISVRFFARWLHFMVDSSALNGPPISLRQLPAQPTEPVVHANDNVAAIEADELDDVDAEVLSKWQLSNHTVSFSGVVFTSVFNPYDGRKNWMDMVTAFCSVFRDVPDATLVLKLGHHRYHSAIESILMCMGKMPAFKCRVILIQGFLCPESFQSLIRATDFVVNTSYGEGQCLPLMEYLSCGKPAVAPKHSGMADYIDEDVAFVVDSWLDATAWPHDPRLAYRAQRHQLNWESLTQAYWRAYQCRKNLPERYLEMSRTAVERMRQHCSHEAAEHKLREFLKIYETSLCACA
ncbi:MAG TPA: glycosyltransferase, partial [Pseudomonadales bacterium]|nr:glycosyltransferase [Pseudomonadales bacterium]